ncbi:GGDEF domain-containing protein [bacterium]|nr:GGDEF domain-containing protein [bacterium]
MNSGPKNPNDKPDEIDGENWESVRMTSTKTEVITTTTTGDELLKNQNESDPAFIAIQGDMLGRVFRLKEGTNTIGRQTDNEIIINQRAVSGRHACVKREGSNVILEDLQSTNGTILNTKRIDRPMLLQQDDVIKVGSSVFKYTENNLDTAFTESLHQKGTVDELTGVYNKAYLLQSLSQAIEVAKSGFPLSIVMFDLDHFKKVNDNFGHLAGDYVLKETCRLIKDSVIRSEDILGRFGGEEFVLIMPDAKLEVAVGVAERVRKTIEDHLFEHSGKVMPVTTSLGVCTWRPQVKTADDFLEEVDKLLYKSKEGGRNRVTS